LCLQGDAAGELGILELVDGSEMPVDQAGVGEWPQVLSRLELRRVRWKKQQVDVFGHAQLDAGMPPRPIEHEDNLLGGTGAHLAGEGSELYLEEFYRDAGRQVEERAPGGGMDKADQIAPGEAMAHRDGGSPPDRGPDPPQERLQADAMLIGGPELDARLREGGRHLPQEWADVFLKSACCSASARAWRGRGTWGLCLRRTR